MEFENSDATLQKNGHDDITGSTPDEQSDAKEDNMQIQFARHGNEDEFKKGTDDSNEDGAGMLVAKDKKEYF